MRISRTSKIRQAADIHYGVNIRCRITLQAGHGGEMTTGAVSKRADALGIDVPLIRHAPAIPNELGDVIDGGGIRVKGCETILRNCSRESGPAKREPKISVVLLAAADPATSMDADDERKFFGRIGAKQVVTQIHSPKGCVNLIDDRNHATYVDIPGYISWSCSVRPPPQKGCCYTERFRLPNGSH